MNRKWLPVLIASVTLAACTDSTVVSSVSSIASSFLSNTSVSSTEVTTSSSSSSEVVSSSSEDSVVSSSSSSSSSASSTSSTLTAQQKVEADIASFSYTTGMALPSRGPNGSTFTWTSSRPDVVTNKGNIISLPLGQEALNVPFTLKAVSGSASQTTTVELEIPATAYGVVTSSKSLVFTNTSEEYLVLDQEAVDVFFVNNGNVPFMDVQEYLLMLDQAIDTEILEFTANANVLTVSYTIEDEDFDGTPIIYDLEAVLDFNLNTFTVNNFNFFEYYVASTETEYGDGLNYVDADYVDGHSVTINLGDYRVDMVQSEDNYLIPIAILNLLFNNSLYYAVYYNGDQLWGFDTFTYSDPAINTQIRASSLNSTNMPSDVKQATYHYIALAFDYFYGLKEHNQVETYYNVIQKNADKYLSGTDRNVYANMFDFVFSLDELHSWHVSPGFYEATSYDLPLNSISQLGEQSANYYYGLWDVQDELEAKFGTTSAPSLHLIDSEKIAVIFFDEFTVDTPVEINAILSALPETVESVVLDLSYNGGGNVGAVFRLFGYMTENAIEYHSKNPGDGSASTYYIESDYIAYDYNWFIKTSSVTFSAANLMASIAQECGVATIIGRDSSGGASSIGIFVAPDGTILMRSSNSVSSRRIFDEEGNPVYISIEDGVTVDIVLESLYDDAEIIDAVNQSLTPQ